VVAGSPVPTPRLTITRAGEIEGSALTRRRLPAIAFLLHVLEEGR